MEIISLKVDETMLHNMDNIIRDHNFSTRTEFIRDAIREKLEELHRDELMNQFLALKGKAKKNTTDEEREKIRDKVFDDLLKKHNMI